MTRLFLFSKISSLLALLSLCAMTGTSAFCQTNEHGQVKDGFSIGWFTYLSNKQEINPDYMERPDASLSSAARISYAGKIEYNRMLNENLEMSIGAMSGAYPFDFHISFDSSFSIFERSLDYYTFDRYSTNYVGVNLGIRYFINLSERQYLSAHLNLNYIFFIPQYDYDFSITDQSDKGVFRFFVSTFETNKEEKGFFAPEVSYGYHYKIGKYFIPYLSFNGVYSKNYPIDGIGFILQGKSDTLQGTFRRRFLHAGVEVGVKVNLP